MCSYFRVGCNKAALETKFIVDWLFQEFCPSMIIIMVSVIFELEKFIILILCTLRCALYWRHKILDSALKGHDKSPQTMKAAKKADILKKAAGFVLPNLGNDVCG